MKRYLNSFIADDLKEKMVFLGGPRQSGKTFASKQLLEEFKSSNNYYNWDSSKDKKIILNSNWQNSRLVVLDEIHKYSKWKNFIKGVYDTQKDDHSFLITGSARLDLYKRGGDSMVGRYHYYRLHPITLDELNDLDEHFDKKVGYEKLMAVGGFPEPFLKLNEKQSARWRKQRQDLIVQEDLRDLEKIQDIQSVILLLELLKERVGSLIVISNLAQDLQVAPNTVKRWITALENMYLIFIVKPYTQKLTRSISKPFKIYFYDNADVIGDIGARFENFVANHLLKKINFIEDTEGVRYELKFLRDKDGREVDFAVIKNRKLESLIEAKLSDASVSKNLIYYSNKLKPDNSIQLVCDLEKDFSKDKISVRNAINFLSQSKYF